jgi:hypothetical protein
MKAAPSTAFRYFHFLHFRFLLATRMLALSGLEEIFNL